LTIAGNNQDDDIELSGFPALPKGVRQLLLVSEAAFSRNVPALLMRIAGNWGFSNSSRYGMVNTAREPIRTVGADAMK
jgi:hypothetical protein